MATTAAATNTTTTKSIATERNRASAEAKKTREKEKRIATATKDTGEESWITTNATKNTTRRTRTCASPRNTLQLRQQTDDTATVITTTATALVYVNQQQIHSLEPDSPQRSPSHDQLQSSAHLKGFMNLLKAVVDIRRGKPKK